VVCDRSIGGGSLSFLLKLKIACARTTKLARTTTNTDGIFVLFRRKVTHRITMVLFHINLGGII